MFSLESACRRDCELHGAKDLSFCFTDVQEFHLWNWCVVFPKKFKLYRADVLFCLELVLGRVRWVADLHLFNADPDPYIFTLMRIRFRLFTLMRIRIRILLKVVRPLVYNLPGLHFEPPCRHCERRRPSTVTFEHLTLLNLDFNAYPIQLFTLMRIRIRTQLPKTMRIRIRNPAWKNRYLIFCYRKSSALNEF